MSAGSPKVYTLPPGCSFADALAQGLLKRYPDPMELSSVLVLLPTRRAARTLREAFLRASDGALLLPGMQPLGDVDEEELSLGTLSLAETNALDTQPAISPLRRQMELARLVEAWLKTDSDSEDDPDPAQVISLARELGRLLDQMQIEKVSFEALKGLAPAEFADHWQKTLAFLDIVGAHWPAHLAEHGLTDPALRRNRLLDQLSAHWRNSPPAHPVIAAGSTGSIPATAELLKTIAFLPQGEII
ncbi:MAG: double-strand break repair protein AddB, partial [Alphaproteobacteria bacterium]|nr:double-strand break repair protein AddB [Alphaproteobacteria bacterium]